VSPEQQQIEYLKPELKVIKSTLVQVCSGLKNLQQVFMSYPSLAILSPDSQKTLSADTSNQMFSFPALFGKDFNYNNDLNSPESEA